MTDRTTVDATDPALQKPPVIAVNKDASALMPDSAADSCLWSRQTFADGDMAERDGTVFERNDGRWVETH